MRELAAKILGMEGNGSNDLIPLRAGVRSVALIATPEGSGHRFADRSARVVLKLFKGDGLSEGGRAYLTFHQEHFGRCPRLGTLPLLQQSLEAGRWDNRHPYAVLSFTEGHELRDALETPLPSEKLPGMLEDFLLGLWVPLWSAGLRFKDLHPGNLVLSPDYHLHMIDAEMMRKSLAEHLATPHTWTLRDIHEAKGLRRMARVLSEMISACGLRSSKARVQASLEECAVSATLHLLGRGNPTAEEEAVVACRKWIAGVFGGRI